MWKSFGRAFSTCKGLKFELLVTDALQKLPCLSKVKHTGGPGDGGVDICARLNQIPVLVQCKCWESRRIPKQPILQFMENVRGGKLNDVSDTTKLYVFASIYPRGYSEPAKELLKHKSYKQELLMFLVYKFDDETVLGKKHQSITLVDAMQTPVVNKLLPQLVQAVEIQLQRSQR